MYSLVRKIIPEFIRRRIVQMLSTDYYPSFSQGGEDMVLRTMFKNKSDGFFVDVGAFHPVRGSNTYFLHKILGWRGINIEARPGSRKLFNKWRPQDINLEMAVAEKEAVFKYYQVKNIPEMNSLDKDWLLRFGIPEKDLTETEVHAMPLKDILDKYVKTPIDLLTVDVEGFDVSVLNSNDWSKYRPSVVLVEEMNENFEKSPVVEFMRSKDYEIISQTTLGLYHPMINNFYFVDKNYKY